MMRILAAALAAIAIALPGLALAQAPVVSMKGQIMCPNGNLDFAKNPTSVMLKVKSSGDNSSSQVCFPSLADGLEKLGKTYDDLVFDQVVVLDFESYGTKEQVLIDGTQAYYLVGAQIGEKVSDGLTIVAFNSKPVAKAQAKELGGKLAKFSDLPNLVDAYLSGELQVDGSSADVPADPPACNT